MKIIVKEQSAGERLDKYLTTVLESKSRSWLQKMIKAGNVSVNGKAENAHHSLVAGDTIVISGNLGEISQQEVVKRTDAIIEPIVVSETDDYLVIDKPAGLMVHPTEKGESDTLIDWLVERYPAIAKVGEDPSRPGIVHRIDQDVSGLLVIAKNQTFFDMLKEQFQSRSVEKEYIALVYGKIEADSGEIDFPIERAASGHRMAALPSTINGGANSAGKRALTEFIVKKRYINYTLLSVSIKTGRTHQIRVHFFAYGHPLVGDELYSTKVTRDKNTKNGLNRIFLVSCRLAFIDQSGQKKEFMIGLPHELEEFLANKVR